MKFKIVADSTADVLSLDTISFSSAPLKIITSEKEYVDNSDLDVADMVETLLKYKGHSSTSCPNPDDWLKTFGDAENVFCITITGTLSGSYNSAVLAKQMYEEMHPERHVYVINSLSAGPELKLIIEKTEEQIRQGKEYAEICKIIEKYTQHTGLIFMLESMKNLANNGRVSSIVAKAVGLLGIRVVGKASDKGDLLPLDKCRGQEKALVEIVKRMKEFGFKGGKVRIAHCLNEDAAKKLRATILGDFPQVDLDIYHCRGLCSYYAEKGGLLVGFEKS